MKKFMRTTSKVLLGAFLLVAPTLAKPGKDDVVARVYEVQGSKLQVKRADGDKWEGIKKEGAGFVKDHFKTDANTTAALELLIGARVGIKKGSEIVLLNEGEAGVADGNTVRKIALNSGGVWAKFNKQEKPLTIQTKGGVMGIKGTEFSVDTTESGETSVVLLEGSVDYQEQNGQTFELVPGQKLRQFEKDGELHTVKGEPSAVDKAVDDFLAGIVPIGNIDSVQDVLNTNWGSLGPDAVNNVINGARSSITKDLPPEIGSIVNSLVPGVPNWSSWRMPGFSIPSIGWP